MADAPFVQETHEGYVIADQAAMNDVRSTAVDGGGNVWAATGAGAYRLAKGKGKWSGLMTGSNVGPSYDVVVDGAGVVWVGSWNGLYRSSDGGLKKVDGVGGPIAIVCTTDTGVMAFGPVGLWRVSGNKTTSEPLTCARCIRTVVPDRNGGLWIGTDAGLYHRAKSGDGYRRLTTSFPSSGVRGLAYAADGSLWIGVLGGVTVFGDGKSVRTFTPKEGLSCADVRCVKQGPGGVMWVGTRAGLLRYDGKTWSLRHSKRWLVSDDVRDVCFDTDGTAWIATAGGVSAIRRKKTTLAAKAEHYMNVCLTRHEREPGLIGRCGLKVPGDTRTWKPEDDDNDGQYTSMYLAMQSYRYAVTKDPSVRARARKAFEALRSLQTVTETPGFVARTVIPVDWKHMHDANTKLTPQQLADQLVRDPRNKYVPVRWRRSSDGKWLWKGDTSSDEITGHFYGYLFYYDLAADEAQRRRVADLVRRIMDGLIDGGYTLNDLDGKHTRWGVWSPAKLNGDPDWQFERGINSVEILSYLKATYHMTGDAKYQRHYLELLNKHGYASNVLRAKSTDPAWRTHIDDELLALALPALLLYETDPKLRELYCRARESWHAACKADASPYFDFVYASMGGKDVDLNAGIRFLRDTPLDLVEWRVDNSEREDLRLVRFPEMEESQTSRLVPPSERGVMRWDKNPWRVTQGDGGRTESDGVYWLLPYWMGRYYGYINP